MTPHHPPDTATAHPTADRPGGTVSTGDSVFTDDSAATSIRLYGRPERLHQRTSVLHQAKICGSDAAATIADLAATHPHAVTAEIARVLVPQGLAMLATKSQDSYRELDHLVTDTGLDPGAGMRTSLYATFHSDNAAAITAGALDVLDVIHEPHVFRCTGHLQIAAYLSTTPKYDLPARAGSPEAIAAELGRRRAPTTLTMTSTVTYVIARKSR